MKNKAIAVLLTTTMIVASMTGCGSFVEVTDGISQTVSDAEGAGADRS